MKYKSLLFISILFFTIFCYCSGSDPGFISTPIKKILIGKIDIGPNASDISSSKLEAALNLAAGMTGKYRLISSSTRDSVAAALIKKNEKPSILTVAIELQAEQIVFISVNRIVNMLRIEMSSVLSTDKSVKTRGIGYSPISYRMKSTDKPLYDPSILKAMQRAFAVMEKDSLIYQNLDEPLNIVPIPTLVIGSIDYQENESLPLWKIFENKVISSSECLDTIFALIRNSKDYVVYDLPTRDSIFALFNLLLIENYRPPTPVEIDALTKLEVNYYISGILKRTESGADLELFLCKLKGNSFDIVRSEKASISEDNHDEIIKKIDVLTRKLIRLN